MVLRYLLILLFLLVPLAYGEDRIELGTFSLATEAGWGAGFELKKDGSATVIPSFDSEGDDETEEEKVS